MKSETYVNYQNYLNTQLKEYKDEYKKIKIINTDLYNLLQDTKLYNKLDIDRIKIKSIEETLNVKKPYSEREIKELDIPPHFKSIIISIYANEEKLIKLKNEYNKLLPFSKMTMSLWLAYMNILCKNLGKILLNGYKLTMGMGMGNLEIVLNTSSERRCNWAESIANKKELLKKGIKLYDVAEAQVYKQEGKEYDGVKWIIPQEQIVLPFISWKHVHNFYEDLVKDFKYKCVPIDYICSGNRKMTDFKHYNEHQILNSFRLSMFRKLTLLMNNDPLYYLKFTSFV